jgi:hypothetical protein
VSVFGVQPDREVIATLADAGVDRVLFGLKTEPEAETLTRLDQLAKLL